MRAELSSLLGNSISGCAYISEIGLKYVLLKGVSIFPNIEIDHCWIYRSPQMIYIQLGQKITFRAIVIMYHKKIGIKRALEFGIKIKNWKEIC